MKLTRTPFLPSFAFACLFLAGNVCGQTPPVKATDPAAELRGGRGFIATEVYSLEEDKKILALWIGLCGSVLL